MTITSKPYTEAYAEGWERIFGPEWSPPKATRNVEVDDGIEWMPLPPLPLEFAALKQEVNRDAWRDSATGMTLVSRYSP